MKDMEQGKEYYLSVGKHAAIVRLSGNGVMQYLELQKKSMNGWVSFTDANDVLERRFGCKRTARVNYAMLTDIDQLQGNNDFEKVLGYINTAEGDQRKGIKGYAK